MTSSRIPRIYKAKINSGDGLHAGVSSTVFLYLMLFCLTLRSLLLVNIMQHTWDRYDSREIGIRSTWYAIYTTDYRSSLMYNASASLKGDFSHVGSHVGFLCLMLFCCPYLGSLVSRKTRSDARHHKTSLTKHTPENTNITLHKSTKYSIQNTNTGRHIPV